MCDFSRLVIYGHIYLCTYPFKISVVYLSYVKYFIDVYQLISPYKSFFL